MQVNIGAALSQPLATNCGKFESHVVETVTSLVGHFLAIEVSCCMHLPLLTLPCLLSHLLLMLMQFLPDVNAHSIL